MTSCCHWIIKKKKQYRRAKFASEGFYTAVWGGSFISFGEVWHVFSFRKSNEHWDFQKPASTADQFVQLIEHEAAVREVVSPNIPAGPTLRVFKWLRRKCCLRNDFCKRFDSLVSKKELRMRDCLKAGSSVCSVLQWVNRYTLQGGLSFIGSYYTFIYMFPGMCRKVLMVSIFCYRFCHHVFDFHLIVTLSLPYYNFRSTLSQVRPTFHTWNFSYYECICSNRWSTAGLAFGVRKKRANLASGLLTKLPSCTKRALQVGWNLNQNWAMKQLFCNIDLSAGIISKQFLRY